MDSSLDGDVAARTLLRVRGRQAAEGKVPRTYLERVDPTVFRTVSVSLKGWFSLTA